MLCDSGSESLRRGWERKLKLVLLPITPVLVTPRAGAEPCAEARAYSKHGLFHMFEYDDCCKKS